MKKVLILGLCLLYSSFLASSYLLKTGMAKPKPVTQPVAVIVEDSEEKSDQEKSEYDQVARTPELNSFTFTNKFNQPINLAVSTNLGKPLIATLLKSQQKFVVNAACIYYVKASTPRKDFEIKLIPGINNADTLSDSYILSEHNRLCSSSNFEIKASSSNKKAFILIQKLD